MLLAHNQQQILVVQQTRLARRVRRQALAQELPHPDQTQPPVRRQALAQELPHPDKPQLPARLQAPAQGPLQLEQFLVLSQHLL